MIRSLESVHRLYACRILRDAESATVPTSTSNSLHLPCSRSVCQPHLSIHTKIPGLVNHGIIQTVYPSRFTQRLILTAYALLQVNKPVLFHYIFLIAERHKFILQLLFANLHMGPKCLSYAQMYTSASVRYNCIV
jgi:hypothetical protein